MSIDHTWLFYLQKNHQNQIRTKKLLYHFFSGCQQSEWIRHSTFFCYLMIMLALIKFKCMSVTPFRLKLFYQHPLKLLIPKVYQIIRDNLHTNWRTSLLVYKTNPQSTSVPSQIIIHLVTLIYLFYPNSPKHEQAVAAVLGLCWRGWLKVAFNYMNYCLWK